MSVVDVGAIDDFPDRTMTVVDAAGIEVGVCRWGREVFAMRNRCPHQAGPLCTGFLQTALSSQFTAGAVEVSAYPDAPVILCPWHRWEFSLRTGEAPWPGYRARTYPVTLDGDRVLVRLGRS